MSYQTAGPQLMRAEPMRVRAHVHAPASEAREDHSGRSAYNAPEAARVRVPFTVSVKTSVLLCAVAMFVMAMLYVSALAQRARVYKEGLAIVAEMDRMDTAILEKQEKLAEAQAFIDIRYEAVQRFGMESSLGKEVIAVYAPETRPAQAGVSLPAEAFVRASAD